MRQTVLVLHAADGASRRTNIDHILCYPKYDRERLYVFHHVNAPVTPELKSIRFDGVVMNYCFLSMRSSYHADRYKAKYAWVSELPAVKAGVPQDDYTDNDLLDSWMAALGVSVVHSPIENNLPVLYPRLSRTAKFRLALTGYVDHQRLARLDVYAKPFAERTRDVGTRVRALPPQFGRAGQEKARLAVLFGKAASEAGYVVDVSSDPNDVFVGDEWYRFLGDCRFTVGSKGGASLNDPVGHIRTDVRRYLAEHPQATYDEVERACFGSVRQYDFTAIGPRLFEAAQLRTVQILGTERSYIGDMRPGVDYVPLDPDLGNLAEVFALMKNADRARDIAESCWRKLVGSERFGYDSFVREVVADFGTGPGAAPRAETVALVQAHAARLRVCTDFRDAAGPNLGKLALQWLYYMAENGLLRVARRLVRDAAEHPSPRSRAALHLVAGEPVLHARLVDVGAGVLSEVRRAGLTAELAALVDLVCDTGGGPECFLPWDFCEATAHADEFADAA